MEDLYHILYNNYITSKNYKNYMWSIFETIRVETSDIYARDLR